MKAYFDTAYVLKCYVVEPKSAEVAKVASGIDGIGIAELCFSEIGGALHRHTREGFLLKAAARKAYATFLADVESGVWRVLPVDGALLRRVGEALVGLPAALPLRAADATHLLCASENDFNTVWSSDRHMLAAAKHFGLEAQSV